MVLRGYYTTSKYVERKNTDESREFCREFTIADCPIFVSDSVVALSAVKNSCLMKYNMIIRGDESTGIFEGDEVFDLETNELLGYVIYKGGFCLQDLQGTVKDLPELTHIKVNKGDVGTIKLLNQEERSPLRFNVRGLGFDIRSIMCKVNDFIYLVDLRSVVQVNPRDIRMATGLTVNGKEVAYGDMVDGGLVVMHKLKPCIRRSNSIKSIEEEFKDGVQEYKSNPRFNC